MKLVFGAGPKIRGYSPLEDYSFGLAPQTVATGGSGTAGTLRDANTLVQSAGTVDSVFSVRIIDSPVRPGVSVANLTPSIVSVSDGQVATWLANGLAQIEASHPVYGTRLLTAPVSRTMMGSTKFTGYRAGSLAADLVAVIAAASSGVTPSMSTTARFSSLANNTRNAALWCKSVVDDTAISREVTGFPFSVLIGQHHILCAAHAPAAAGGQVGFVGSDGAGYVATTTGTSPTGVSGTDIAIYYVRDATGAEIAAYNAAHPSSKAAASALSAAFSGSAKIKPMALLPAAAWAASNCPLCMDPAVSALANADRIPVFHFTRNNNIGIWEHSVAPTSWVYNNGLTYPNELAIAQEDGSLAGFSDPANVGGSASGDMTFVTVPAGSTLATANPSLGAGYPILLGCTHGAFAGQFLVPWTPLYLTQIQAAMQASAQAAGDPSYASYAPTVVSLTGYASY